MSAPAQQSGSVIPPAQPSPQLPRNGPGTAGFVGTGEVTSTVSAPQGVAFFRDRV